MRLKVRNVLGVKSADIPLEKITLVAGRNGAGKSSLLDCLWMVASGKAEARGVKTKKGAAALIREGSAEGAVILDFGAGQVRMLLPDGNTVSTGDLRPQGFGSPIGIGAVAWMALSDKERAAEFSARADAVPGEADVAAWLQGQEVPQPEDEAAALWERIEERGWDPAYTAAREAGTKLKGRWEQITGVSWGDKKAMDWRAPALLPGEEYDLAMEKLNLAEARSKLQRLIAEGAADQREVERLRPLAARLDGIKGEADTVKAAVAAAKAVLQTMADERAKLPPAGDDAVGQGCPHCGEPVRVTRNANGVPIVAKAEGILSLQEQDVRRRALYAANTAMAAKQQEVDELESRLDDLRADYRDAAAAQKRLAEIEAQKAASPEELTAGQAMVAHLEARVAGIETTAAAREVAQDWLRIQPMIRALAPDGVRKTKAMAAVEAWNRLLAEVAEPGKLGPVTVDAETFGLRFLDRPYALCSESERWRCDAVMAMALAKREGAAFLGLDRLDVLVRDLRPGVFRCAAALGIPVVIACTVPDADPTMLPRLKAAGLGSVWWLNEAQADEVAL